jgi:hypothetical protein
MYKREDTMELIAHHTLAHSINITLPLAVVLGAAIALLMKFVGEKNK